MVGMIKKEDVEKVRAAADLYDIVSATVTLKPSGTGTFVGLCPFHDEKTGSFNVRPSLGVWHCFGCGLGGDVFKYVEQSENIDFREAVELLADKYHIELHYENSGNGPARENTGSKRTRLLEACEEAQRFFVSQILTKEALPARPRRHGDTINVTRCKDGSVIVEDFGRGMPVDWNKGEERYNWELLFCEMYAGGKYGEGEDNYEFSLGLNGLGLCATQYASAWMTADIYRDGFHYHLDFQKGENVGGLHKEPYKGRRTGSIIHWKPDDEVFTDIDVPGSYYKDVLRRQAVVNAGLTLNFTDEKEKDPATGKPWKESWCYEHGIADYVAETAERGRADPVSAARAKLPAVTAKTSLTIR